MPLAVDCPHCECQCHVPPDAEGRLVICPKCRAQFTVPARAPVAVPVRTPVAVLVQRPPRRSRFHCPFCGCNDPPVVRRKVSTAGWVMFVVLLCFLCLPLFWIGLLMKEEYRICADCGIKLG